jgi:hypothetical protein
LKWRRLLAAYRAAEAERVRYEAGCRGRSFEEQEGLQAGYDARGAAKERALGRVVGAAAPDLAALGVKIRLIAQAAAAGGDEDGGWMAALARDARRLL